MRVALAVSGFCSVFYVESMNYLSSTESVQEETSQWADIHKTCGFDAVENCISSLSEDLSKEKKDEINRVVKGYFVRVKEILYSGKYHRNVLRFLDSEQQKVFSRYLKKCRDIGISPDQEIISISI